MISLKDAVQPASQAWDNMGRCCLYSTSCGGRRMRIFKTAYKARKNKQIQANYKQNKQNNRQTMKNLSCIPT